MEQLQKDVQTSTEFLRRFKPLSNEFEKIHHTAVQTELAMFSPQRFAPMDEPIISPSVVLMTKKPQNKPKPHQLKDDASGLLQLFDRCKGSQCWVKVLENAALAQSLYRQINAHIHLSVLPELIDEKSVQSYIESRFKEEKMGSLPGREETAAVQFIKNYVFSNKQMSQEGFKKMKINIKRYKNCIFFGTMESGRKEGIGLLVFNDGRRYEGEFTNDMKSGFGVQLGHSETYIGEWFRGHKDGFGLLIKGDGSLMIGYFTEGVENGVMLMLNRERKILMEMKMGDILGFVVQANENGEVFVGNRPKGEKQGFGLQKFINNDFYLGNYQVDPQGYGEYYWSNGAVYKGLFLNGLRHGKGVWVKPGGDHYQGEYKNDKKCGYGKYVWGNGIEYIGEFYNDLRHGPGRMLQDGVERAGNWVNGLEQKKSSSKKKKR